MSGHGYRDVQQLLYFSLISVKMAIGLQTSHVNAGSCWSRLF